MSLAVWLDEHARDLINREAVKRRLRETGGALFGWRTANDIVVACASGPGKHAKHRPNRFESNRETTATAMKLVRECSQSRYGFVGSWHTHPLGRAIPSSLDATTARELSEQDDLLVPEPLLLILSTKAFRRHVRPAELRAWCWDQQERVLRATEICELSLDERYCPTQPFFN